MRNVPGNVPGNIVPISRDDELLEAASRWVLKIDEGPISASDEADLGAWLDEHIMHRELLLEVCRRVGQDRCTGATRRALST